MILFSASLFNQAKPYENLVEKPSENKSNLSLNCSFSYHAK